MFMPVVCVGPVGMSMVLFHVIVFMNMWFTNGLFMIVEMMIVVVIVQMYMSLLLM
jgi:hypothetical protein